MKTIPVDKLKEAMLHKLKDEIVTEEDMKELNAWIDSLVVECEPVQSGSIDQAIDILEKYYTSEEDDEYGSNAQGYMPILRNARAELASMTARLSGIVHTEKMTQKLVDEHNRTLRQLEEASEIIVTFLELTSDQPFPLTIDRAREYLRKIEAGK